MKKSKVIVPAMALLLFSTAASITGTVAWFSATRVFEMNAGEFRVAQLDGNLECDVAGGVGTFKTLAGNIAVGDGTEGVSEAASTTVKHYLLDASYDAPSGVSTGKAYRISREGAGYDEKEVLGSKTYAAPGAWKHATETGAGTAADPTVKYFVAVSWKMTFKYTFAQEANDVGIFLDLRSGQSKYDAVTGTGEPTDAGAGFAPKGMRIAFLPTLNGDPKVWGNNIPLSVEPEAYSEKTYNANDKVVHEGKIYKANAAIGTAEEWNPAHWTQTYENTLLDGDFSASKAYVIGNLVNYDGKIYRCKTAGANAWNDANWDDVSANNSALRYVSGTAASAVTAYNPSNYVYTRAATNPAETRFEDATSSADESSMTTSPDYIGRIKKNNATSEDSSKKNLEVTCVAWFEGEDPNIVNGTAMAAVGASMKFYARSLNSAADAD